MNLKYIFSFFLFLHFAFASAQVSENVSDIKAKKVLFSNSVAKNTKTNPTATKQKKLNKIKITVHKSDTLTIIPVRKIEYKEE